MRRYPELRQLSLPLLLTTLVLLLSVSLRGDDDPANCRFAYFYFGGACSAECAMETTSCSSNCHQQGAGCPATEMHETPTTARPVVNTAPGAGLKVVSTTNHNCMTEWMCTQTEYELTECRYTGSGISYCNTGTPSSSSCYHCERGLPLPDCIVELKTLEECQLGG